MVPLIHISDLSLETFPVDIYLRVPGVVVLRNVSYDTNDFLFCLACVLL